MISRLLTDGSGVSAIDLTKLAKDLVADFLIGAAAATAAVNVLSLQDAVQAPEVAAFALAGAALHAIYRVVLRWATSP